MAQGRSEKGAKVASSGRFAGWVTRLQAQAERPFVQRGRAFCERHKRYAPPVFFFGGVVWDALTLERIDAWFDNVFLLVYLVVLGVLILTAVLHEYEAAAMPRLVAYRDWFPPAIQFFLGALFSAYVIFYFQSASLTQTSLFLVVLVILLGANEFLHRRVVNLYLLLTLYFLAAFSFFIFFIPVVTKTMSYGTFLAGGVLSLGVVVGMLAVLWRKSVFTKKREAAYVMGLLGVLLAMLNLFYLQNWIPPVPLAMRYGGVFHDAARKGDVYELYVEKPAWYKFWLHTDERFHRAEGEAVYCFAAVFAPTRLKMRIYHAWSFYEEAQQAWVPTDRIGYEVVGGRFNGYRGYTLKRNVRPGRWRVDVETEAGQIIGRIRFTVEPTGTPVTDLKQVLYE